LALARQNCFISSRCHQETFRVDPVTPDLGRDLRGTPEDTPGQDLGPNRREDLKDMGNGVVTGDHYTSTDFNVNLCN